MRIQVFSDLHVDVRTPRPIQVAADVDLVLFAGDACEGIEKSFATLRTIVPASVPVTAVAGNHEFYRRCLPEEIARGRAAAAQYGITFLENDEAVFGSVRVLGTTLWTDYALFGDATQTAAMQTARSGLNDHRRVSWSKKPWLRFRPQEALALHREACAFLEERLAAPFDGPTVVLTHHAPHPGSVPDRYRNDLLTAAYVSDLSGVIKAGRPALWVHGHVHTSFDYRVGDTRIVCNAHGYGGENPAFDPALVLELGS